MHNRTHMISLSPTALFVPAANAASRHAQPDLQICRARRVVTRTRGAALLRVVTKENTFSEEASTSRLTLTRDPGEHGSARPSLLKGVGRRAALVAAAVGISVAAQRVNPALSSRDDAAFASTAGAGVGSTVDDPWEGSYVKPAMSVPQYLNKVRHCELAQTSRGVCQAQYRLKSLSSTLNRKPKARNPEP
jgi:hypothetical protein